MRSNESHKKYNIEKECLLMRSNESFLSPKLGTTFQQPSWGCAEVLFPLTMAGQSCNFLAIIQPDSSRNASVSFSSRC